MDFASDTRSIDRGRRVLWSGVAGILARGASVVALLITVPISLRALGTTRYGVLVTITSSIAPLYLADLGVSNGLITLVAAARGRGDVKRVKSLVSSAWITTCASGIAIAVCFLLATPLISWPSLLNAPRTGTAEVNWAVAAAIAILAVSIPLGIVQRLLSAYQEAYIGNAWTAAGSVLSVVVTWGVAIIGLGVPAFVFASVGSGLIALAVASFVEFFVRRPHLRPSFNSATSEHARELLSQGVLFLGMQLAVNAMFASDNLIIIRVLGPQEVTAYSIAARLFVFTPMVLAAITAPLWPAYADAVARADRTWIRRTAVRSVGFTLACAGTMNLLILLLAPWLLQIWVGKGITVSTTLLAGMALWTGLNALGNTVSLLLNGLQVIRVQALMAVVTAIVSVATKIWAASRWGSAGMPWAQAATYAVTVLAPGSYFARRAIGALFPSPPASR